MSVAQFRANPSIGNALAVGFDGLAVAVPFLPGGIGAIRQIGKTAETAIDSAKAVPNPYGKAGGPAHQAKVAEVAKDVESRGLTAQQELKISTPGGNKDSRFVDVVGRDAEGKVVEMHQVGKQNKNGTPVSREVKAMDDIEKAKGVRPTFHPYN